MTDAYLWAVASSCYELDGTWEIEWRTVSVSDTLFATYFRAGIIRQTVAGAPDHRFPASVELTPGRRTIQWNACTNVPLILKALEYDEEHYDLAALWTAVCEAETSIKDLQAEDASLAQLRARLERVRICWKVRPTKSICEVEEGHCMRYECEYESINMVLQHGWVWALLPRATRVERRSYRVPSRCVQLSQGELNFRLDLWCAVERVS
jgi:hypothetical protein